jgi:1-phosphatidylinositol phosphodiesterase
MNVWDFPEKVNAGQSVRFEVEWCENIFKVKRDDAGEAYYALESNPDKKVEFAMWDAKEYNFTVKQIGFEGIDPTAQRIKWVDDGEITIEIAEKGIDLRRWMKQIDGNTPINKLSIPGTHDTLTYALSSIGTLLKRFTQTQDIDLIDQLNCGARYLDIRCDEHLQGCHGSIGCQNNMWEVFSWVKDFLAANPDETIVMRFKYDGDANDEEYKKNIEKIFNEYCGIMWKNNLSKGFPLLNDVRGKIVILDSLNGYYVSKRGYGYVFGDKKFFDLQDDYSGPDEDEKFDEIRKYIDLPYDPDKMKINHVSATGKTAGFLGWSPKKYAEYENPRVVKYIAEKGKCVTGLLIFDFIDQDISRSVILTNDLM